MVVMAKEHRKLAKNAYAKFEDDDDDDDSTSSSLDQSIFSEEEKLNDGGAPETPNSSIRNGCASNIFLRRGEASRENFE